MSGFIQGDDRHQATLFPESLDEYVAEFLDHIPSWNARDLERKLQEFRKYYNRQRSHRSLGGSTSDSKTGESNPALLSPSKCRWNTHCHGHYKLPAAARLAIRHKQVLRRYSRPGASTTCQSLSGK
jgi:hypothetical protein